MPRSLATSRNDRIKTTLQIALFLIVFIPRNGAKLTTSSLRTLVKQSIILYKFNFTMESLQTRFHIIDCHEVL
ncbi:hypothetical protein [Helicobacter rodentium]|uniref:hypothetical protein n=1 Tax=Helicobacter rodentium TaxID=59617 RepID=UPI0012EBC0AE|nr:hypothetical protein [Helicobacter rodentium]